MDKWSFSAIEAINAVTTIHANPQYFAKVMAMTKPRHAVAYHFQNDFDTQPIIRKAVEQIYDGPVDYAEDFMVWNVTKEGVRTRMAVVILQAIPHHRLRRRKSRQVVNDTRLLTQYWTGGRKNSMRLRTKFTRTLTRNTGRTTSSS